MINKIGMYVQADSDVGDASHRTALAAGLNGLIGEVKKAHEIKETLIKNCEIAPGTWCRHPEGYSPVWSSQPSNFSRDQACRVIFALAVLGERSAIKRWFFQMAKRGFLHQNNCDPTNGSWRPRDIMTPQEFGNVIRGLDLWFLYPVLLFIDLLFITAVYTRSKWDGASLYVPDLKFALKKFPTPAVYLANYLNNKTTWLSEALNNHDPVHKNGCAELQPLFVELSKIN